MTPKDQDSARPTLEAPMAPTSWGTLFDRIEILKLKCEHATNAQATRTVERELDALIAIRDRHLPSLADIAPLLDDLADVNRRLWAAEDAVRDHERRSDFGPDFVETARTIFRENDRRARVKREIDKALASDFVELKIYRNR